MIRMKPVTSMNVIAKRREGCLPFQKTEPLLLFRGGAFDGIDPDSLKRFVFKRIEKGRILVFEILLHPVEKDLVHKTSQKSKTDSGLIRQAREEHVLALSHPQPNEKSLVLAKYSRASSKEEVIRKTSIWV